MYFVEICKPEVRKKAGAKQITSESVKMDFKNVRTEFPVLAPPANSEAQCDVPSQGKIAPDEKY